MQSLHYNSGSIKLTRERSTMVSRWEANEVARWIGGLAGIQSDISDLFLEKKIDGVGLSLLLREDLIQMGIKSLDQQLIIMHSIDLLLTLANRLTSETLALLFMRIHCTASTCYNLLKRPDDKDMINDNSNVMNSPEFYASICNLSDAIVVACHWLGRLPFIENIEYIDLRRKIIKVLVQIRVLLRNLRLVDQINMPKSKLILEINELRTTAISLVRQNKDSLFSSDCYLTRVHLRRPTKDDVNIEYTTMPDFTHVISSIETESMGSMGSGFSAINIGDEIIEINNQVVIGWDPKHFNDLLRSSSQSKEICLLVKKMPRHNDDEVYTKRLVDGPQNPRRSRARGALERRNQQTQENRTMLLEQEGEIEVESDDETLYQSKRSSQIKRDQHSSLPDLTESLSNSNNTYKISENSDHIPQSTSSTTSSVSTTALLSPRSPTESTSKSKNTERPQSAGVNHSSPNLTPRSARRLGIESYISTFFRPRQDTKSVIADMNDHTNKDHPQLVNIKRIHSIHKQNSSNNSISSLHDDQMSSSPPTMNKSESQTSLQTISSTRSSFSNIFKSSDSSEKNRTKRSSDENGKNTVSRNESKMEVSTMSNNNKNNNNSNIVTNKPPLNHSDSRKTSASTERRQPKRRSSYRNISCKDLGKGDCEGFLHRYLSKATISFVSWRLYWCVLKGGTLYVFKSKEDKNQEIEIKLEGKNVSPTPDRRKYAFRIADESSKNHEYFYCSSRDEMAKWMNKMGLAAINFNIDDSKIAGFNKGFIHSNESSPVTTPIIGSNSKLKFKHQQSIQISSAGDSENDSDKESILSWQKSASHNSSISDFDKSSFDNDKRVNLSTSPRQTRSSSSASFLSLPETHTIPVKSASNRLISQMNISTIKGHHRTCSSPIRFPPAYEDDQENAYVNTAPKSSDSELPNDQSYQRTFVNSQILNENPSQEFLRSANNSHSVTLNSSGGFITPTPGLSSASSDKTPSYSPQTSISSSSFQRPSNNSVFFVGDDDLSSRSSRSASYSLDRPTSSSEDPLSPVFQNDHLPSPKTNSHRRLPFNSSSSSSSEQHSPAIVRTAPLYISVYSTTPPIPLVKSTTASSSVPPNNDNNDESCFTRRSPSPQPSSILKKTEPGNNSIKHVIISSMQQSNENSRQQQQQPVTFHRHHRSTTSSSKDQEK